MVAPEVMADRSAMVVPVVPGASVRSETPQPPAGQAVTVVPAGTAWALPVSAVMVETAVTVVLVPVPVGESAAPAGPVAVGLPVVAPTAPTAPTALPRWVFESGGSQAVTAGPMPSDVTHPWRGPSWVCARRGGEATPAVADLQRTVQCRHATLPMLPTNGFRQTCACDLVGSLDECTGIGCCRLGPVCGPGWVRWR